MNRSDAVALPHRRRGESKEIEELRYQAHNNLMSSRMRDNERPQIIQFPWKGNRYVRSKNSFSIGKLSLTHPPEGLRVDGRIEVEGVHVSPPGG